MSRTHRYNKIKGLNKKDWENIHHLQNVCNNWKTVKENLKPINEEVHNAIHVLFGNQNPIEMMKRVFKLWKTAFNEDYIAEQYKLWKKYQWRIIKQKCYKWRYSKNSGARWALYNILYAWTE